MNLLQQFSDLISPVQTGVATITGHKGGRAWIGQAAGQTVMLYSDNQYTTNQNVYYNRLTGEIIGHAPSVVREFGV